jgi:hypothetical protein
MVAAFLATSPFFRQNIDVNADENTESDGGRQIAETHRGFQVAVIRS